MRRALAFTVAAAFALSACSSMDESQRKTAQTTGIGAAAGAAVGAIAGGTRGAAIGAAVGGLGGYAWSQHMENQRKQMETATQGTGVEVQKTADNRLKMMIPGDISFDPGRSEIKPSFRPVLDRFAQSLVQNPGSVVQIVGHTDATGNDAANVALSLERANATRDYLASRGVPANRIATDGRGSREPVASNDTATGRASNRRVEIFVQENPA